MINNNTIIKNKELPLFSSLSNIGGDHGNIIDNSTEFSWSHWLFDTVDDSRDKSTVEACDSQNAYFLKVDKDTEPLCLDILEDIYEASRITNTDGLLEIKTNNEDENSGDQIHYIQLLQKWTLIIEKNSMKYGFAFMIIHSEKDKENGIPRHYVYTCIKGKKYISRKEAHIVEGCNKEHYAENCKFHINTYHQKKDNLVYITKIEDQHNYELIKNIDIVASHYYKLSLEICNE
ncbi:29453_t:CDS:2, partial [Gigaspora margarita]